MSDGRPAQYGPEHFAQQVIADMQKRQNDWTVICLADSIEPSLVMALREQFGPRVTNEPYGATS